MTRTERTLRDGARFLLEAGYNRYQLMTIYGAQADKLAGQGKHDEAREVRSAMEELREVENGEKK